MSRTSTAAAVIAGTAAGMLLLAVPPAWADELPTPSVSATTVRPLDQVTFSGSECFDEVDEVNSPIVEVIGAFNSYIETVQDNGTWSVAVTIGAQPGTYPITIACHRPSEGRIFYPRVTITVAMPVTTPPWWQQSGAGGYPGPPKLPVPTTAGANTPARTTVPPAAAGRATTTVGVPPTTPSVPPTRVAVPGAARATPAPGCRDCRRLTGKQPPQPGDELQLAFTGFQPGERVRLVLHSTPVELGTYPADASGMVTAVVTIPVAIEAGAHTLTLTGPVTGDRVVDVHLATAAEAVRAPVSSSSGAALAVTLTLVGVGAAVLAGGGLALHRWHAASAARRRGGGSAAG